MRKNHYREQNRKNYQIKHGLSDQEMQKHDSKVFDNFEHDDKLDGFQNEDLLTSQINNFFKLKDSNATFDVRDV